MNPITKLSYRDVEIVASSIEIIPRPDIEHSLPVKASRVVVVGHVKSNLSPEDSQRLHDIAESNSRLLAEQMKEQDHV